MHLFIPVLEEREFSMTFQIGMVAENGILLASDLKKTNTTGFPHGWQTPKITADEKRNFAHCSAGDELCNTFTTLVRDEIDKGINFGDESYYSVQEALSRCVKKAYIMQKRNINETSVGRTPTPKCSGGITLIVFRGKDNIALWMVDTRGAVPNVEQLCIGSSRATGVNNSAIFFLDRYFREIPNDLDALIPLAVHTVLMAEGDTVGGLEIGLFSRNRFGVLDGEELRPYRKLSKEIDIEILNRLGVNQRA
jgi:hypothetical protein